VQSAELVARIVEVIPERELSPDALPVREHRKEDGCPVAPGRLVLATVKVLFSAFKCFVHALFSSSFFADRDLIFCMRKT
jgi:hypothetical protein